MYDLRLEEVAAWIREKGARTIALQMPEGLKVHAQAVARELEGRTGASFLIVGDPCYGAWVPAACSKEGARKRG